MSRLPAGLAAVSGFFAFGALMSGAAAVALLTPGGSLEPMWRLNPQAREDLQSLGPWAIALMGSVSLACALTAIGLWHGSRWGQRLAVTLLAVNLLGDIGNAVGRGDLRTLFGIPIAAGLIAYLVSRRVRAYIESSAAA
jgi:hypothetical protein